MAGKGQWLVSNSILSTFIIIVSLSNVEVMSLLDSRIFNQKMFSMGWAEKTHLRVRTYGLIGNVLDNVPQLVIQCFYLSENGVSGVAIASIVASGLSLFFGTVRRLLFYMVLKLDPTHKNETTEFVSGTNSSDILMSNS